MTYIDETNEIMLELKSRLAKWHKRRKLTLRQLARLDIELAHKELERIENERLFAEKVEVLQG